MPFVDRNLNGQGPFLADMDFWESFSGKAAVYGVRSGTLPGFEVLFIGESSDLRAALAELVRDTSHCIHNYLPMDVLVEQMPDANLRRQRARDLIEEYRPPCNAR